jgi:hypothetical protein
MKRIRTIGSLALLAAALIAFAPAIAGAQTPAPPRPPGDATLSGEVVDTNPLTVRVDGQDRLLRTAPDVVVNRDGHEVKLDKLEKGDIVTFTTNPDNSVQRIDVTDADNDALTKWLLVGLLALLALIVAGVVWYMTQRRDRYGRGTPVTTHR